MNTTQQASAFKSGDLVTILSIFDGQRIPGKVERDLGYQKHIQMHLYTVRAFGFGRYPVRESNLTLEA